MIATGGLEWELNQWMIGSWSFASELMIGRFPWFPMSLTFSTPSGREGWGGKVNTRGWMLEKEERSGLRIGRFFGVTTMVMVKPFLAKR